MVASPRLQALLAERAQRSARKGLLATVVAGLRSPQAAHPKQMAALRSRAKRRAKLCTRRSGKTSGGNREDLARALEQPGWRGTYCHTTRGEAKKLAWRSDTNDGWCDLLQQHGELTDPRRGTWTVAGVEATINESELTISFSNGSLLDIFAADDPASAQKFRGRAKHKVRIDEAQQFPDLQRFCVAIVGPTLRDFDGELELDGTPGEDCSGYYYEITKPDTHGERIVGWEVHSFGVTDNPFFGSTSEERWARTAAVALEENGWTGDEPEFQREWLGHWVRAGANFVYAVHSAPPTSIGFAPLRRGDSWRAHATQVRGMTSQALEAAMEHGWYDHEASVRDLPQRRGRRWTFGLGVDFGHSPDPVALSIPAIASDLPEVYEMWSWKKVGLVPDDWRCLIELVYLQLGNDLIGIVGDPGGLVGADLVAWRERLGLPIEAADKAGKRAWQEMLNGDIRRGRILYRDGSPLLDEHRHLVRLPGTVGKQGREHADRRLPDGRVPGNHISDGWLYIYRHLTHHLHRPAVQRDEGLAREERMLEEGLDRMAGAVEAQKRAAGDFEDDGWEFANW